MTMPRLWRLPGVGSTIDLNRVANITPISDSEGELAFQIHLAGIEPVKLACKYEQHRKGSVLDAFTRMRESTLQAWAGNDSSQLHVPFSQIEYIEEPEPGTFVMRAVIDDPLTVDLLRRHISIANAHNAIDGATNLDGNGTD